ncbi:MFS general substrate transporter [Clavulina sp. PMI_390]|nr:MFS general substrate transporter [Clavulina sp. PMI_390]
MSATESTPLLSDSSNALIVGAVPSPAIPNPQKERTRIELLWLLVVIWSGIFVIALDITIIPTLISPIGSYFDASHQVSYIGTSYLLSVCCFSPLYGRLAEVLGRKGAMLLALGLFGVGTTLCGLAPSMVSLIVARAITGMGGGGIMTVASVALSDVVPLKHRGLYDGLANLLFGLGSGLGSLGGFVNDRLGWRWAFFAQVPIIALSFVMVLVNTSMTSPVKRNTLRETLGRIDWLGSLLLVIFVGSFLVAVTFKTAEEMPWTSPQVWGLLLTSLLSGCGFLAVEAFVSTEPILLLRLLNQRTPLSISTATFAISIIGFSTIYSLPLYFTAVKLQPASEAGAHLFPNSVAIVASTFLSGWIIKSTGKYWLLSIASAGAILFANLLFASWNDHTSSFQLWVDIVPSGSGMASLYGTTMIALISSVSHAEMPVAIGLYYLFRNTGQVLGVSMSGAITQSILRTQLRDRIHAPNAEELIREIRHSTSIIPTLEPELRDAAVTSWAIALRAVFIFNAILALVALLACIPMEEHELSSTVSTEVKPSATPAASAGEDVLQGGA